MRINFIMVLLILAVTGCGDKKNVATQSAEKSEVRRIEAAQSAEKSEVPNSAPSKIYNIHPLNLGLNYSTNPFAIRNSKAIGRIIQTEIFASSFIDEGRTAKINDENFGVFCRMSGAEYSKSPIKRGYVVVKGVLIEEGGKLGLNNCTIAEVDKDAAWRSEASKDDYVELLK